MNIIEEKLAQEVQEIIDLVPQFHRIGLKQSFYARLKDDPIGDDAWAYLVDKATELKRGTKNETALIPDAMPDDPDLYEDDVDESEDDDDDYNEPAAIEVNKNFAAAIDLMNSGVNVFLTGKAGTGKSTLLRFWRQNYSYNRNIVTLAPTGVAALNANGQTIHSFAKLPPQVFLPYKVKGADEDRQPLIKNIDTIIIDEVSMVSALLFDGLDIFLKKSRRSNRPFGGVQVIQVGDMYQLPPVVTKEDAEFFYSLYTKPYFFAAEIQLQLEVIELEKVYRQDDANFIELLNNVREGRVNENDLQRLNTASEDNSENTEFGKCVTLAPTNTSVARKNRLELNALHGEEQKFIAEIDGKFKKNDCPADVELCVKIGAQIILVSNDPSGRWVNGSVGVVEDIVINEHDNLEHEIIVNIDGAVYSVRRHTWEMKEYIYDKKKKTLIFSDVGSCHQFPLKLAWSLTCHKSQGMTLSAINLDLSGSGFFAHGQAYVALSRLSSLQGFKSATFLVEQDLNNFVDNNIVDFFNKSRTDRNALAKQPELFN